MPATHFAVRDVAVAQMDHGIIPLRLKRERHDRLKSARGLRYPGMLKPLSPLQCDEPPVMRPIMSFELNEVVEKAIHHRIDDHQKNTEPQTTRTQWIDPQIVNFAGARLH